MNTAKTIAILFLVVLIAIGFTIGFWVGFKVGFSKAMNPLIQDNYLDKRLTDWQRQGGER